MTKKSARFDKISTLIDIEYTRVHLLGLREMRMFFVILGHFWPPLPLKLKQFKYLS